MTTVLAIAFYVPLAKDDLVCVSLILYNYKQSQLTIILWENAV